MAHYEVLSKAPLHRAAEIVARHGQLIRSVPIPGGYELMVDEEDATGALESALVAGLSWVEGGMTGVLPEQDRRGRPVFSIRFRTTTHKAAVRRLDRR